MRFAPERRSAEIIYPRQFRTPLAVLADASNRTVTTQSTEGRCWPAEIAVVEVAEFPDWGPLGSRRLGKRAWLDSRRPSIVQPLPPPRSTLRALIRQAAARIASEAGL